MKLAQSLGLSGLLLVAPSTPGLASTFHYFNKDAATGTANVRVEINREDKPSAELIVLTRDGKRVKSIGEVIHGGVDLESAQARLVLKFDHGGSRLSVVFDCGNLDGCADADDRIRLLGSETGMIELDQRVAPEDLEKHGARPRAAQWKNFFILRAGHAVLSSEVFNLWADSAAAETASAEGAQEALRSLRARLETLLQGSVVKPD